jgi:hypothetical protein
MAQFTDASPRARARLAGAMYLLTVLAGMVAQGLISNRLVVAGDAAGTAANILGHEALYRLGMTLYLVEMASQVAMTAIFYELLKPVDRGLSIVAAFIGLTGCVVKTVSRIFYAAPLLLLNGAQLLPAFGPEQAHALALVSLGINDQAAAIALVFFGLAALIKGVLIVRSTFLPRLIGTLAIAGGAGWSLFLYPPLAYRVFPGILAIGLIGAVVQIAWLLAFGVDEQRWKERAAWASSSIWR